jgi:hypothetical protein
MPVRQALSVEGTRRAGAIEANERRYSVVFPILRRLVVKWAQAQLWERLPMR